MSFYKLGDGTHHKLDMGRLNYFWEDVGEQKKYHMVKRADFF
jgi:hypothetical protein